MDPPPDLPLDIIIQATVTSVQTDSIIMSAADCPSVDRGRSQQVHVQLVTRSSL